MSLHRTSTINLLLVSLLFAAGCRKKPSDPEALAVVGGESVTEEELVYELGRHTQVAAEMDREEAALATLLGRKRMVAAARERGLAERPEVRRAIDSILIKLLVEQELQPKLDAVEVSDREVADHYERRIQEFTEPASKSLAILFRQSREADSARRAQHRGALLQAIDEVRSMGVPAEQGFGKVSVRNSEHQASRYRGGLIEPLVEGMLYGDLQEALLAASAALEPGEFSGLIERPEGLYAVRLAGSKPRGQRPLESVELEIRRELLAAREAEVREGFHDRLTERFPAEVGEVPAGLGSAESTGQPQLIGASE